MSGSKLYEIKNIDGPFTAVAVDPSENIRADRTKPIANSIATVVIHEGKALVVRNIDAIEGRRFCFESGLKRAQPLFR